MEEIFNYILDNFQNNQFFAGVFLASFILGVWAFFRQLFPKILSYIKSKILTVINIHSSDESYQYFQEWLMINKFDAFKKNYKLISLAIKDDNYINLEGSADEIPYTRKRRRNPFLNTTTKFILSPFHNRYIFFYKGKLLFVRCYKDDSNFNSKSGVAIREYIEISYFGWSKKPFNNIIDEINLMKDKYKTKNLALIKNHGDLMEFKDFVSPIVLKKGLLEEIENDLYKFTTQREKYVKMGIPYHRGYMFAGPPGTGKTMLTKHLAAKFKKPLYSIDLKHCINEGRNPLNSIDIIPEGSIILFEDFDCLYEKRETKNKDLFMSIPDFSTLLNKLDGVDSADDLIYIFTTNHIEKIDHALLRPGRLDKKYEIGLCTQEQIERLILKFFPNESVKNAKTFSKLFNNNEISPAEIQDILLVSDNLEEAIKNAKKNK